MLTHGRLVLTRSGFMLDEVKSLLQKSLRRKDLDLIYKATRELKNEEKDQLTAKSLVVFLFEDHCLNHPDVLKRLYKLHTDNKKLEFVELLTQCYTNRFGACAQVVALREEYRNYVELWKSGETLESKYSGLVLDSGMCLDVGRVLDLIDHYWRNFDEDKLMSLFGLLNMANKVERRLLTKQGKSQLLNPEIKVASVFHLLLSILNRIEKDDYMKSLIEICFKFMSLKGAPFSLIAFSVLGQKKYKQIVLSKLVPALPTPRPEWTKVERLTTMPSWAVDKHTFRGKCGHATPAYTKKRNLTSEMTDVEREEFHGTRPKRGIKHFFEDGCKINNALLTDNSLFERAIEMYMAQKPSQQKCHKMTAKIYTELKKSKRVVFKDSDSGATTSKNLKTNQRKRKQPQTMTSKEVPHKKKKTIEDFVAAASTMPTSNCDAHSTKAPSQRSTDQKETLQRWPLLQLPTGSGKVYTMLQIHPNLKVLKGPYRSKQKLNTCLFFHEAMKRVYGDPHTLDVKPRGDFLEFPLVHSKNARVRLEHRAFHDCIAKKHIEEHEGAFVDRSALGVVQLHKLPLEQYRALPVSIWAHFVFRYALNIGDSGLYNAITTVESENDVTSNIYGIDMEEIRHQVKGNDVLNMMFVKLPRKDVVKEIKASLCENVETLSAILDKSHDYTKLDQLFNQYDVKNEVAECKNRLARFRFALSRLCEEEVGV